MGRPRSQLSQILNDLVDHVYFQPPNGLKMEYPCITYELDDIPIQHADNRPYRSDTRYTITVIDRDPDSVISKQIAELPMCSFNRSYKAEDLNHYVYNLNY